MFNVVYSKQAQKYLEKVQPKIARKVFLALNDISKNITVGKDIKIMSGSVNKFRLRLGQIRVIYEVHNDVLIIQVIKIGARGDVYKGE